MEKFTKLLQAPVKTTPFYLPPYYKSLQPNREKDKQYWKEIAIEFLKQKHNADITKCEFPIKMYMKGLLYELYFITIILQGEIIIGPTKKLVALYIVGNLALLD